MSDLNNNQPLFSSVNMEEWDAKILYEDNHIIAINKSSSEIVQGDKTGDVPLSESLKSYLKKKYNKTGNVFVGVTHRLDRPVSGVVLFAKTSKALSRLNDMFRNQEVDKYYWAVVQNRPQEIEGELVHYLKKNSRQNKSYASKSEQKDAKLAKLNYQLIAESNKYFLLQVELHTGRHHQIRVQLASMNCPIKGDLKYGSPRSNPNKGISLHARFLSFIHPVSKEKIEIIAPVPKDDNLWLAFEEMMEKESDK